MTIKFSKERVLNSNRFKNKRDAVNAILKKDEMYTLDEVDCAIEAFYRRGTIENKEKISNTKKDYEDITKKALGANLQNQAIDFSEAKDKKALYKLYEKTFEKQEG